MQRGNICLVPMAFLRRLTPAWTCARLQFKGKTIMFDCGCHPGYRGDQSLPFFDEVDVDSIDILLVTHFHVDHAAAVPYFLTKTTFKGKVYMTYPTLAICKLVWSDFIKVSGIAEQPGAKLYTDQDITDTVNRIICIDYHQEVEVEGVRFWCYNAGHVIGACMFMVQIAGVRVLYTGDYSRQEDRHLMAAEMPAVKVDVLVVESTYGVQTHEPRRSREQRLLEAIVTTLQHGGRVLLPVFAIGRAQELLLLLDEYWRKHPELQKYDIICLSGGIAKRCIASYQTYINQMNKRIRHLNDIENPFEFKYIKYLSSISEFDDNRPSVVMASPGMLQNGPSRELFDRWCEYRHNSVVITGYCVANTLAKDLLDAEPATHTLQDGREVALKMKVHYVSFSAHADFIQTSQFIDQLRPAHIVLVHGEANMMASLKKQLVGKYEHSGVGVWSPDNTETVTLQGLVLHNNFQLTICSMEEMGQHAGLEVSHLIQRQLIPYSQPWEVLRFHLARLFDSIVEVRADGKETAAFSADGAEPKTRDDKKKTPPSKEASLRILDAVTLRKSAPGLVELEWSSNPVNDLVADSVLSVILQTLSNPTTSRAMAKEEVAPSQSVNIITALLEQRYGPATLLQGDGDMSDDAPQTASVLELEVDGHQVQVDAKAETVTCGDSETQKRVESVLKRIVSCMHPYASCSCPTA
jgi:cleavage and polyadenylation specificity factor subunit 3